MPFDFSFTKEQECFREFVKEFLENEVVPYVGKYDKLEKVPTVTIKKLAKAGFFGVPIPEKYGGAGFGEIGYSIMLEELARVDNAHATIIGAHTGICLVPIWLFGNEEQREKYLPSMCKGEKIGAFGLTEPEAGSDAANIQTTAEKDGGEYVLNGTKMFISNGEIADVFLVFAATNKALGARGGITAFIVEKDFPGFKVGVKEKKMGIRAAPTNEIVFDNCRVPEENVLGKVGYGFIVALTALDGGRATLSAGTLGGTRWAIEKMIEYVKLNDKLDRKIGDKEMVQWFIANSAIEYEAARHLVYQTVAMVEQYFHKIANKEKVSRAFREKVSRYSAMVKALSSETASRAIERTLQLYSSLGYTEGLPVEKAFRDSIIGEIYEGTNEIQRWIIARDIVERGL